MALESDFTIEQIYNMIDTNFDQIYQTYNNILDESTNTLTQQYISDGHDPITAYKMSFLATVILILQLNNIDVK